MRDLIDNLKKHPLSSIEKKELYYDPHREYQKMQHIYSYAKAMQRLNAKDYMNYVFDTIESTILNSKNLISNFDSHQPMALMYTEKDLLGNKDELFYFADLLLIELKKSVEFLERIKTKLSNQDAVNQIERIAAILMKKI